MALQKQDRISFSEKLASIPLDIAAVNRAKVAVLKEQQKDIAVDDAHKRLVESKTILIDGYQAEITQLDGSVRSNLTEADISDSANFTQYNFLYPRDPQNPPPSIAPSVWIRTKPYARNKIVGKGANEAFLGITTKESDLTSAINATLASINTYALIERVTGQACFNGTCSLPQYTNQTACTTNAGVWTPGPDTISTNVPFQALVTTLISQVNTWKSFILNQQALILTSDTNTVRAGQNSTAIAQINSTVSAINTWLAFTNYNIAHGQSSCSGFYAYNPALLGATKFNTTQVAVLTGSISTRTSFISTRLVQLGNNLGTVIQNLGDASITGAGLYFERANFLGLRLNMLGGSAVKVKGYDKAIAAQSEQIANINASKDTYSLLLICSNLTAPSNGTKVLHLSSAAGLSIGDTVYLASKSQEEITLNIEAVNGNSVTVGTSIPPKYQPDDLARLYKDIT